jgi:uncharacterized membrane protein
LKNLKVTLKQFVKRLSKPSSILSLLSQVLSVLLLLGVHIDQTKIMGIGAAVCSVLVALGILSNPDTKNKGYGDDLYPCSNTGELEKHVVVNGQLVCETCGAVYGSQPPPPADTADITTQQSDTADTAAQQSDTSQN